MLTTNVDVADGLSNGAIVTVSIVVTKEAIGKSSVESILVIFDTGKITHEPISKICV